MAQVGWETRPANPLDTRGQPPLCGSVGHDASIELVEAAQRAMWSPGLSGDRVLAVLLERVPGAGIVACEV
jgi:hypothetical protein